MDPNLLPTIPCFETSTLAIVKAPPNVPFSNRHIAVGQLVSNSRMMPQRYKIMPHGLGHGPPSHVGTVMAGFSVPYSIQSRSEIMMQMILLPPLL